MQQSVFQPAGSMVEVHDPVWRILRRSAEYLLILALGLSPILFLPTPYLPLGYGKVLIVLFGIMLAALLWGFSILRKGEYTLRWSFPVVVFAAIAVVNLVSAVLSRDLHDALVGDGFAVTSVAAIGVMLLIMVSVMMLRDAKTRIMHLYVLLVIGALLLAAFHISRFVLGTDMVSLRFFGDPTASPFGRWNDLGLYFGLVVLLGLVAVEQLPLTLIGRVLLGVTTLGSLAVLAVVNFFGVWIFLSVVSLMVLMYSLTRHRFTGGQLSIEGMERGSVLPTMLSVIVFMTSLIFIIGGSTVGGVITSKLGISYVEVRPSTSATIEIAEQTLRDHAVVGIGPNRFSDAWRLYKNPEINQTIFWATDFEAGSGYVPTMAVTTGMLGAIGWIIFLGTLCWNGIRMFLRVTHADRFWYFIGVSSFVSAGYFWIMNMVYVPTVSVLILTALTTGIFLAAYSVLVPGRTMTLSAQKGGPASFMLIGIVIFLIAGSTAGAYFIGQHASALYTFNKATNTVAPGDTIEALTEEVARVYQRSANDVFVREIVNYQLAQIQALIGITEPTDIERSAFDRAVQTGVNALQIITRVDSTDPANWRLAGQFYGSLALAGVESASDRAKEALTTARSLDPQNPIPLLFLAQLEARVGNTTEARALAESALGLRATMSEAVALLSELDIAEGKTAEAIARIRALITLEPQNPARRYQLGVLHYAQRDFDQAIIFFEQAVALNQSYANARYFLGLSYLEKGRKEDALTQLRIVRDLNPENTAVSDLVGAIERGEVTTIVGSSPVNEPGPTVNESGEVTTAEDPDTDLVSPVNIVPDTTAQEETPPQQ